MQQAVMNSHRTDVEERQGRSFTQHLMAATVDQTQPPATPRGMRSVELADIMGAEGTSVEVEEALRAAVSPEPTVEAVASPIPVHTLRRDQASPVVTPEGTAKRPRGAKWLCRRPTVRLRRDGPVQQPWMRVHDVEYGWLSKRAEVRDQLRCTVARSVLMQLQWDNADATVGAVVPLQLCMGDDVRTLEAVVAAENIPSLVLGSEALAWLFEAGWQPHSAAWGQRPDEPEDGWEPVQVGDDLVFTGQEAPWDPVEDLEQDAADFWAHQVRMHQKLAVEGDEPGGLVSGGALAPPTELLRDMWAGLERPLGALQSGPKYTTPEDNPEEFRSKVQEFVPGKIHDCLDAWRRLRPAVDAEVLRWVQYGYEVPHREEGTGLRLRNGKAAREKPDSLQRLVLKRLRNKSWECTQSVVNVLPANIAPKDGDEDGRLILDGKPLNEHYSTWRVRYEGVRTVPLCVTKGCWMFSIDLYSGYDAVLLTEDTKGLFGVEMVFSPENTALLLEEGLLTEDCVQRRLADGSAVVLVQPRTLPQGFTNSCAVFTKLTRQLVRSLRARGVRLVHLLDDFLFCCDTEEEAIQLRGEVIAMCLELGLYISWKKAVLQPSHVIRFLGFVVDSVNMRFYVPGDKVEALEDLIRVFLESPSEITFRQLASVAGKIISMGTALPPARLFTRELYQHIRPEGDWDATLPRISESMVQELREALEWVRVFNAKGAPIQKAACATGFRIRMDASDGGFGVRLDAGADLAWTRSAWAMAGSWKGMVYEHQVHRELQALHEVLTRAAEELESGVEQWGLLKWIQRSRLMLWSDSVATVAYINEGAGSSDVMYHMMKGIWAMCIKLECSIWAEHAAGTELVAAGVDAMSRASEFSLAQAQFRALRAHKDFGRRGGFRGFTVDACASLKTAKCLRYLSRGSRGLNALGDFRTAPLCPQENYYICPPVGLIELVVKRLVEAKVCATLVVPNWVGKAWHVFLRKHAAAALKLPWQRHPATWWDLSERKAKPHELANRWEFVAFALDLRPGAPKPTGVQAVLSWKDAQPMAEPWRKLDFGGQRLPKARHRTMTWHRSRVFRVLSLAGGIGSVGWCLKRVVRLFSLDISIEVVEVELSEQARALAAWMGDPTVSRQHDKHNIWDWVADPGQGRAWVRALGQIDCVVCGFPCQDMSEGNRRGRGLRGNKSNVYFAMVQVLRYVLEACPAADFIYECTNFKRKHPRDWEFVCHDLGVQPTVLDAGTISAVWRNRAFWTSFPVLALQPQEVPVAQVLQEHRKPAWRWRHTLPTIMASGPSSWNQRDCVMTWQREQQSWQPGPLLIAEVEEAMGFGAGCTLGAVGPDGLPLSVAARWHGLGNAIHAGILSHTLVSCLVSRGVIPRASPLLQAQRWTMPAARWWDLTHQDYAGEHSLQGDGPKVCPWEGLRIAIEQQQRRHPPTHTHTHPLAAAEGPGVQQYQRPLRGAAKVSRKPKKKKTPRIAQWRVGVAQAAKAAPPQQHAPSFQNIFNDVDAKGVPRRKHVGRALGAPRPTQAAGQHFWEFVDEVARDLMILSRADATWKAYAAWYEVFTEFCAVMGVHPDAPMPDLLSVMLRSVTVLWLGAGYAASTIELYVTAVASTLKDRGQGNLKEHPDLKKLLEGVNRNLGNAATKKLAIEGRHLRGLLTRSAPDNDAEAWTGEWSGFQWFQTVAFMILGWCAYLRCSEIMGLQLCDLTWLEDQLRLLVRRTKADQRGVTTTTCLDSLVEAADPGSDTCLLTYVRSYVETVLLPQGLQHKFEGCTRSLPGKRAMDCPVCPYVFPRISVRGVEPWHQLDSRMLRKRMKAACRLLEADGVLDEGASAEFSVISLRRGGNSVCAARGVRDKVRTHHGRWGLAAQVARGLTSEGEYNSVLARDGGAVSKALHADFNETVVEKKALSRRC